MSWSLWSPAITNFSHGMASFAVNWMIQSTLLILAGLITGWFLARRGSAVQFVVYSTTLVAVLICPPMTWMLSFGGLTQWSMAVPWPVASISEVEEPAPSLEEHQSEKATTVPLRRYGNRRVVRTQFSNKLPSDLPGAVVEDENKTAAVAKYQDDVLGRADQTLNGISDEIVETNPVRSSVKPSSVAWLEWITLFSCLTWFTVSASLLVRLGVAWNRLSRIRWQAVVSDPATSRICGDVAEQMGVDAPPVLYTPFLPSPCLAGVFAPVVLLPEANLMSSLRDVLIHELAHLRRCDAHWNLLRRVTTCLFWFQPLLFVLARRMDMTAEEVCDDFVVEYGCDRTEYAQRLLDVAEFSAASMATAAVAMVSFRSMLKRRITRIMDTSRRLSTRASRRLVLNVLMLGSTGTFIIGLLGTTPSTSAEAKLTKPNSIEASSKDGKEANASSRNGVVFTPVDSSASVKSPEKETVLAERNTLNEARPAPVARGAISGIISSPTLLSGQRRWQMYTKNPGTSSTSVAWSPDGRWLAIANGLIVRLYDFQDDNPELKIVLAGHSDTVKAVRFNNEGSRLATASADSTVRVWGIDGTEQFVYRGHEDAVQDVSWNRDGVRLASAGVDGTVRIWTTAGKTIAVVRDHEAPVNAVAWNPDGKLLASGCENKTIRYWNAEGVADRVIEAHVGPVRSIAWNSDGSQLVSCDYGIESASDAGTDIAHIKVWDREGKSVSSILITDPLSYVSWCPDGTRVVIGCWRSIRMWTIGDRNFTPRFISGINGIIPVAWRPTGDMIAAGPMILDQMGMPMTTIPLRTVSAAAISLNPDNGLVGVGHPNREFDFLNSNGEQVYHSAMPANGGNVLSSISWSPDGKVFVPGIRYNNTLQQYDKAGAQVGSAIRLPGDMRSVDWSRDGKTIVTGGDSKTVTLVNLETEKATTIGRQNHGITQVRFTPDQTQVCSAGFDSCIRFWSLDGKPLKILETIGAPIDSLGWASDGGVLVSGHQDSTLRFWSGEGELLTVVGGHAGHVEAVEFNPEGTLVASGSRDNTIRIWKRDGTPVSVLRGHLGAVHGIQWTADGRQIYSCSEDGTVRKWSVETGVAEWQSLSGEAGGYVTLNSSGQVTHGDERILETEFAFFIEDDGKRLTRTSWDQIRAAVQPIDTARAN